MIRKVLVTGSGGLIGFEAAKHYISLGDDVTGIDSNHRSKFFGKGGDVNANVKALLKNQNYLHYYADIAVKHDVDMIVSEFKPDVIIHCAAQPSHDLAAQIPFDDFSTNAIGTLNLLEATRKYASDAVFIYMSTNKVYGDNPNKISLMIDQDRYSPAEVRYANGIDESMSIDNCTHSLFGVSKLAADVMTQEYGRYFGMKTVALRGGCLTGAHHASVQLHGYLSYIVKCAVHRLSYTVIGYEGLQVRDQIHSSDVIRAFDCIIANPQRGVAFNIGGCTENSISVRETVKYLNSVHGLSFNPGYDPTPRVGDHMWYISDMSKFKKCYPEFRIERSLNSIIDEMVAVEKQKL